MYVWKNTQTGEIQNDRQSASPKAGKKRLEFAQKMESFGDVAKLENPQALINELDLKRADFELQASQALPKSEERKALLNQAASCNTQIGRIEQYQLLKKAELKFRREEKEWFDRRKASLVKQFGGVPEDYEPIEVPPGDEPYVFQARHIIHDPEEGLKYDVRPLIIKEKGAITVTAGWMRGNERLKEDDTTDFKGFGNTENQDVAVAVYRKNSTSEIEVKIFAKPLRGEWGMEPEGYTKIGDLWQGVLDTEQKLYEVKEWQKLI
jgi:hypothetical protein